MVNYILTTPFEKHRYLVLEEKNTTVKHHKFLSLHDLEKMLYGSYQDNYLFYMFKKGYLPTVASQLKSILWQIPNTNIDSVEGKKLWELKQDLIRHRIMIPSTYLKEQLKQGTLMLSHESQFLCDHCLLEDLKKEKINIDITDDLNTIHDEVHCRCFDTIRDELADVASSILKLVKQGISLDRIHIINASLEYQTFCHHMFELFQIPYTIQNRASIYSSSVIQTLLTELQNSTIPIQEVEMLLSRVEPKKEMDHIAYQKFLDLIGKYIHEEGMVCDLYQVLKYECKMTYFDNELYENAVSIESEIYLGNIEDYYFIVGCNQETLPKLQLDIHYVSDALKEAIRLDTSMMKNKREEERLLYIFSHLKHVSFGFSKSSSFSNYTISPILDKLNLIRPVMMEYPKYDYLNNEYNRYLLGTSIDTYLKYHEKNRDYQNLCHHVFIDDYQSYQNQYQVINENEFPTYLKGMLTLSYSSLDTYFHCPFRFYLKHILRVKEKMTGNAAMIGTLFHDVLSQVYDTENLDSLIAEAIDEIKQNQELSKKELFYLGKYQVEIKKICMHVLSELERTEFQPTALEESFTLEQVGTLHIQITGVIDKIVTLEFNGEVYAIVVDYKTGNTKVDLNKVIYGLDMQLLMYLYFLKHTEKLNHPKIAGFFLQHILPNVMVYNEKKIYEEMREDFYKLDGYTKDSTSLLYHIDNQYMDKCMIKGLRVKKDGSFYQGAKIFDDHLLESLLQLVETNLQTAIQKIETCQFEIAPIRIGYETINEMTGCAFCTYRDICFRKIKDIKQVKEYKSLEFLGGDERENKTGE